MSCLFGHKWNGCKCSKCDKTRNEQHTWANDNGIAHCSVCGEKAIDIHLFSEEEKQFLIAAFLSYSTNVGVNLVTANNMRLLSTQIAMSRDNSNLAYFDRIFGNNSALLSSIDMVLSKLENASAISILNKVKNIKKRLN